MNINVTAIRCSKSQKKKLREIMEKEGLTGSDIIEYLINIMVTNDYKKLPYTRLCDTTFSCRTKDKFVYEMLFKEFRENNENVNGSVLLQLFIDKFN